MSQQNHPNSAASFRLCLNTSTIRGQKLPLVEEIALVRKAGYDGIEPWIDEIDRYLAEGGKLPDLKHRIEDSGLTVEGAIGFFEWVVDDPERRKLALDEARRNIQLLQQIGGVRIAAPAMGATDRSDIPLPVVAERYAELLKIGQEYGVTPLIEVWGFSKTLGKLSDAAYTALECGLPGAAVLLDVYHLYKGGSSLAGIRGLNSSLLPILHMNDYPAQPSRDLIGDADRVYPGDGIAPMDTILQDLKAIGFTGSLSLELFREDLWAQDPALTARTGVEKLRAVLAHAFA